ncbi:MAG: M28 family peptidase [Opitutales bacterium]
MVSRLLPIDPRALTRHLRHLTETIGVRPAGRPGEAAAADYMAAEFAALGAVVRREEFPVMARVVRAQELEVYYEGTWHPAACSLLANTPGTNGDWLEGPLAYFAGPTDYQTPDLGTVLRDQVVLHLGTHIESCGHYRRLIEAGPRALVMVDVRYPGDVPLADSIFPAYRQAVGGVPAVNVAYQEAWRWRERGATRVRLRVDGGMQPAVSGNVIADLPGDDPAAGVLFVGGHHDTQADSVGADDNGSATAGLLELARVLAARPRRRTIRLISFGAEEQLSVGSAVHVRRQRAALARDGRLMFNLDSFGSWLGWNTLVANGPPELAAVVRPHFARHGQHLRWTNDIVPFADHFPFVAAGVPGLYLGRQNCTAGRFFHHRPDDDLSRVDVALMASLLAAVGDCLAELATLPELPFPSAIPVDQQAAVAAAWDDLFGGWTG